MDAKKIIDEVAYENADRAGIELEKPTFYGVSCGVINPWWKSVESTVDNVKREFDRSGGSDGDFFDFTLAQATDLVRLTEMDSNAERIIETMKKVRKQANDGKLKKEHPPFRLYLKENKGTGKVDSETGELDLGTGYVGVHGIFMSKNIIHEVQFTTALGLYAKNYADQFSRLSRSIIDDPNAKPEEKRRAMLLRKYEREINNIGGELSGRDDVMEELRDFIEPLQEKTPKGTPFERTENYIYDEVLDRSLSGGTGQFDENVVRQAATEISRYTPAIQDEFCQFMKAMSPRGTIIIDTNIGMAVPKKKEIVRNSGIFLPERGGEFVLAR
ncbi:MAG: hypothetical protein FWE45_02210 [Firmicutes bacterium]|nr:hypothetical protein [Bacillota bacterium]